MIIDTVSQSTIKIFIITYKILLEIISPSPSISPNLSIKEAINHQDLM